MPIRSTSRRTPGVVAALGAVLVLAACAASPSTTPSTTRADTNEPAEPPSSLPETSEPTPQVATDSTPAGLQPLADDERATLESDECPDEIRRVVANAPGAPGGGVIGSATRLIGLLTAATPQTPCIVLATRDARVYLARTIETLAIEGLTGLARATAVPEADAHADAGVRTALCPSAPATPADLEALRDGPVAVDRESLRGGPWECVMSIVFDFPTRYQYEIRTAPDGRSSEIIARGFPVAGQERPEELFVRVSQGDESPPVIYRRPR
jgi:hypothetical protein